MRSKYTRSSPLLSKSYRRIGFIWNMLLLIRNKFISAPRVFAKRLYLLPHMIFYKIFAFIWKRALANSYYLNHDSPDINLFQRIKKILFLYFNTGLDLFYRQYYRTFEKQLTNFLLNVPNSPRSGIALMIGSLGPGGAERQVVTTLLGLEKKGIPALNLVCQYLQTKDHRFFLPHFDKSNVNVIELIRDNQNKFYAKKNINYRLFSNDFSGYFYLGDIAHYMRTIYALGPETVHFWLDEINIKGGMAAVALGVPRIILSQRSMPPYNFSIHKPYFKEGYRWLAKQPGVVLTNNSAAGARAYEQWLGLPTNTIKVIHNGFDIDQMKASQEQNQGLHYRKKMNIPENVPLLGTVIRLSEEKRPMLWLEIAAEVRKKIPTSHFLIVGNGPLAKALKHRAEQVDLKGSVHLVGHESNPSQAMLAMDLFLLTSRMEGLPNVLVEAQALGVPVVTTNVGGAPETLMNQITGWILEHDDAKNVAELIVKLLQDQEWLKTAHQKAPEFIQKAFSIDRMIDDTLSMYQTTNQQ